MIAVAEAMLTSDAFTAVIVIAVLAAALEPHLSRVWRFLSIDDDRSVL